MNTMHMRVICVTRRTSAGLSSGSAIVVDVQLTLAQQLQGLSE
jgi:hypothetical protein